VVFTVFAAQEQTNSVPACGGNALSGAIAIERLLSQIDAVVARAKRAGPCLKRRNDRRAMKLVGAVFFGAGRPARATVFSSGGRAIAYRDIEPGGIFGNLRRSAQDALGKHRSARNDGGRAAAGDGLPSRQYSRVSPGEVASPSVLDAADDADRIALFVVRKRLVRELLRLAQQRV
jgi:hypothetical protein